MIQLNSLQKSILRDAGHPAIPVPIHPTKEILYKGFKMVFSSVDTGQDILKVGNPCLVFFKHSQPDVNLHLSEIIIDNTGRSIVDFQRSNYDFPQTGVLIGSHFADYIEAFKMMKNSINYFIRSISYEHKLKYKIT
ncbi:MAG: hypothetical protein HRU29_01660 [Rhizobiales bacterium]|nr:hypothetical protein [Hyphomicrobiales bacterium]NRB13081.1 hypothetical protein [Hyphomicrobiales bacterium]